MPDFQTFTMTRQGAKWRFQTDVHDSRNGQRKKSGKQFVFPDDLDTLPADLQTEVLSRVQQIGHLVLSWGE